MGALASFGRGYTIVSAIFSTFIGIIFIILGIGLWVHKDSGPNKHNDRSSALILIIFGILMILISWFWVWFSQKYETVADVEGVAGLYQIYEDV